MGAADWLEHSAPAPAEPGSLQCGVARCLLGYGPTTAAPRCLKMTRQALLGLAACASKKRQMHKSCQLAGALSAGANSAGLLAARCCGRLPEQQLPALCNCLVCGLPACGAMLHHQPNLCLPLPSAALLCSFSSLAHSRSSQAQLAGRESCHGHALPLAGDVSDLRSKWVRVLSCLMCHCHVQGAINWCRARP